MVYTIDWYQPQYAVHAFELVPSKCLMSYLLNVTAAAHNQYDTGETFRYRNCSLFSVENLYENSSQNGFHNMKNYALKYLHHLVDHLSYAHQYRGYSKRKYQFLYE